MTTVYLVVVHRLVMMGTVQADDVLLGSYLFDAAGNMVDGPIRGRLQAPAGDEPQQMWVAVAPYAYDGTAADWANLRAMADADLVNCPGIALADADVASIKAAVLAAANPAPQGGK